MVSGSLIGTMPVSRITVTVQMRFEPDIGTYSVGSMMITPTSQPAVDRGRQQINMAAHAPARLTEQKPAHVIEVAFHRLHALKHRRARRGQAATDDHVANLPLGVTADHRQHETAPHAHTPYFLSVGREFTKLRFFVRRRSVYS